MTDKVVILITAGSSPECEAIAGYLVESRLAACVNITQPIRSVYRWEGKVTGEEEFLVIVKTRRDLFDRVRSEVLKKHSTPRRNICSGLAIPWNRRTIE